MSRWGWVWDPLPAHVGGICEGIRGVELSPTSLLTRRGEGSPFPHEYLYLGLS